MSQEITVEQIATYITRETPKTFDVFEKARDEDDDRMQMWSRGRIDGLLQILGAIDRSAFDMLQADWRRRQGFDDPALGDQPG